MHAIEIGSLVVICGAGLSIAPPSEIPLAADVANKCLARYSSMGHPPLDPALRGDLNGLAEHFAANGWLDFFLGSVVPWDVFVRPPNEGHSSLADMLLCRALFAAITTNYDFLVETCTRQVQAEFDSALDGDEARRAQAYSPYLKIHGCSVKERHATVWAPSQLTSDALLQLRIAKSTTWLASELRDKYLIFIGFWSDWNYLNRIIESALTNVRPASVLVVDPRSIADLQTKAPTLWNLMHTATVSFEHLQASGAAFLDDLRIAYSRWYLRRAIAMGRAAYGAIGSAPAPDPPVLVSNDAAILHQARCDAEGVPRIRAPRLPKPLNTQNYGVFHLLLTAAGAVGSEADYVYSGKRVRVINGADRYVNQIKEDFSDEPPAMQNADVIVCAGADQLSVPASVVRAGVSRSIVRPAPAGEWLDMPSARVELGI